MRTMNFAKAFALAMLLLRFEAFAEENNNTYGLSSSINFNVYNVDFKKLPDCPSCSPGYDIGSGFAYSFGLFYERKLNEDFSLGLKGEYFNYGGLLNKSEKINIIRNQEYLETDIEHSLDTRFASLGLTPYISFRLFDKINIHAGAHIGYLISKSYEQNETIKTGAYLNGDNERNKLSGDINSANKINLTANIGVSYDLFFSKDSAFIVSPSFEFSNNIIPIINSSEVNKFNISSIKFGAQIKYNPKYRVEPKPIYEYREQIDTIKVIAERKINDEIKIGKTVKTTINSVIDNQNIIAEISKRTDTLFKAKTYNLNGSISAFGLDAGGSELANPIFVVEEYIATKAQPLLNYIFFDENSAEIPNRYIKLNESETNGFDADKLAEGSQLASYYNVLNIIGKRMNLDQKSKLKIIGCNSGVGLEKNNKILSQKRAESVANYLKDVWNIDSKRLILSSRDLPIKASTPIEQSEKAQENARVEFYSESSELMKYILLNDTIKRSSPPIARFKINAVSEAGIASARIKAECINESSCLLLDTLFNYPQISLIDWRLAQSSHRPNKISAYLILKDSLGKEYQSERIEMPVKLISIEKKREENLADSKIEKFNLMLFDFDKADVKDENAKTISFVKSKLKSDSKITITGYADITGDKDYNIALSNKRAESVKKALGVDANILALGSSIILFDNKLPEGRFLSRIVEITIETPIKNNTITN